MFLYMITINMLSKITNQPNQLYSQAKNIPI